MAPPTTSDPASDFAGRPPAAAGAPAPAGERRVGDEGLVVPEGAGEDFAQRTPPIAHEWPELDERRCATSLPSPASGGGREGVAEGRAPAAEHPKPRGDPLGIAEDRCYSGASRRKSVQQRRTRGGETLGKHEWRPDRPAANFVEGAG